MKRAKHTAGNLAIALDTGSTSGDPQTNLARLEEAARDSIAFGADLPFDEHRWEIQTIAADRRRVNLWFTVNSTDGVSKRVKSRARLQEPFATFLKSIIRLSQAAVPDDGPERHEALLRGGRYLHDQLEHRDYDPAQLTTEHFLQAEMAAVCRDNKEWSHFAVAQNLLKIASVVREHHLSRASIDFAPRTRAPDVVRELTHKPRDPDLLPSKAALEALPKIAQQVKDPTDVCMMRAIELLHCAPMRIGELLSLPDDCEVLVSPEGRQLTIDDLERGTPVHYGLRYKPEKNPDLTSDVKWISSAAIPLARRALNDLRRHTAEARKVAAYMEEHPGKAWLPERFRKRERLTIDDAAEILDRPRNAAYLWLHKNEISIRDAHVLRDEFEEGLSTTLSAKANEKVLIASARALLADHPTDTRFGIATLRQVIRVRGICRWLRVNGIPVHPDSISREELEAKLVSMNIDVSADFPWKRSECLFLFPKLFFKMDQPLRAVVSLLNRDQLRFFVSGTSETGTAKYKYAGIFKRLGFTEPDGEPIHVTSHMFRRWLATLAMDHEMSGAEVQNWLGQTSERSSGAYDYRTSDALAEEARKAIAAGLGIGPIAEIARSKEPRDRDTFLEAVLATAHITPFGVCLRDWITSPCDRHGACVACEKQTIVKGEPAHREEIARSLRENRILLDRANAEVEDGQSGAGKYAQHLVREVAALEATLAVHDDPSIAEGTLVQFDLPAVLAQAEAAE